MKTTIGDGIRYVCCYNNMGRLAVEIPAADRVYQYTYDSLNRLTQINTKAGGIQKNRYDGEGLRAELEENGRLVRFLFHNGEVVLEEPTEGAVTRYIRGYDLISSDSAAAKTYYHYTSDNLGSITHVTDEDGNICNQYGYDAFGSFTTKEETIQNRFCYTGEQYDPITSQYYLRARFYNPVIGRFLNEDTYYGDGLNLYAYCHNNPVNFVDPSGHGSKPKPIKSNDPDVLDVLNRTTKNNTIPTGKDFVTWFDNLSDEDFSILFNDKVAGDVIGSSIIFF